MPFRERKGERDTDAQEKSDHRLPPTPAWTRDRMHPTGTEPATEVRALTGDRACDLSVHGRTFPAAEPPRLGKVDVSCHIPTSHEASFSCDLWLAAFRGSSPCRPAHAQPGWQAMSVTLEHPDCGSYEGVSPTVCSLCCSVCSRS